MEKQTVQFFKMGVQTKQNLPQMIKNETKKSFNSYKKTKKIYIILI